MTDELLCKLASSGDRSAEETLVLRYMRFARACSRPYFLIGGDSEDLLQEAMFGLLKAIREFDEEREASFRTFAEICVKNRIRSAVTAAARDKHAPLNFSVPMEEQPSLEQDPMSDPEEQLINREEESERLNALYKTLSPLERLNALYKTLSPLEQRILSLYLHGFSYREIGEQVGRTDKSVDNAVQRIRRKVAKQFGVFSES